MTRGYFLYQYLLNTVLIKSYFDTKKLLIPPHLNLLNGYMYIFCILVNMSVGISTQNPVSVGL